MAESKNKINDFDLGLEENPNQANDSVDKATKAMQDATANAILSATFDMNSKIASRKAEQTYIIEKKKYMLTKCKNDKIETFVGLKIYANYFGPVFTFLYNTIPVTVRFDGSEQKFPAFICKRLNKMISEVSESNTNKVDIDYR